MTISDTFTTSNCRGLIQKISAGQTATATLAGNAVLRFSADAQTWQNVTATYVALSEGHVRIEGDGTPQTPVSVSLSVGD